MRDLHKMSDNTVFAHSLTLLILTSHGLQSVNTADTNVVY